MELGEIIKIRRAELGLSLEDIGRIVGVNRATVLRWESGLIRNIRKDKMILLADALQTTPGQLQTWAGMDTSYRLSHKVVLGIDIGGSSTKIVGFKTDEDGILQLIDPMFVKANDPIASVYGAFGKFTAENGLSLDDIQKVMVTGVGSSYVQEPIYRLPCEHVTEFRSIGLGGLYLSGYDKAIVVSLGTGTAIVYAVKDEEPKYLGGTGVGGGTLIGLSKKMLGMDTVTHIEQLAQNGDLGKIDLKVSDISRSDILPGFSSVLTASNFGNISDIASSADIALGIINMVFETIAMMSIFASRSYNTKDIVLTGNLTTVLEAKEIFEKLSEMFHVNFIIPKYSEFGPVIGA
ncbi:MAG: XRE family transcriptional regulator, partial [Clostridia bacterium]|nr:XRE family transcriptional regulator [Clostridia bacterium]